MDLFKTGFFVRQPAWHGKGTVVQDYPGKLDAMKLATHDHEIGVRELQIVGLDGTVRPLSGWKALVRMDTDTVVSVMKSSYEVIQNHVPWDLIDSLFTAGTKWDTAGILAGRYDENRKEVKGQVYWCLAYLDEPSTVTGDNSPIYPYLAATWSHDGSQSMRIRGMQTRIVCANTHHAAMYGEDGTDLDINIRHIGDISKRIAAAKEALTMVRRSQQVFLETANELATLRVSDAGIEAFIEAIIPVPTAKIVTDRVRNNVENDREKVRRLFNQTSTPDRPSTIAPGIRNTAYGLVEAGVEYFDHVRRFNAADTYFSRNVMKTDKAKAHLIETAREIATANAA